VRPPANEIPPAPLDDPGETDYRMGFAEGYELGFGDGYEAGRLAVLDEQEDRRT
jgi:hypothetical protein